MKHEPSATSHRTWTAPATYGTTGGRERGRELRHSVLAELEATPPDGVLAIDLAAVKTLDFSAADELVGGLVALVIGGVLDTRRFVLTGLGESARESVEAVLKIRKRHCLEVRTDRTVHVLGPLSTAHEETLQFVAQRGEVAVADVAEQFWSEPNMTAATNRLNTLASLGLVVRRQERGGPRGNRFVYRAIVTTGRKPTANKPPKGGNTP